MILEEFGNLLVPVGIFQGFSSDKEDLCDEDCEGVLMSEDTTAICTDWISEMKRADQQKMVMMLHIMIIMWECKRHKLQRKLDCFLV